MFVQFPTISAQSSSPLPTAANSFGKNGISRQQMKQTKGIIRSLKETRTALMKTAQKRVLDAPNNYENYHSATILPKNNPQTEIQPEIQEKEINSESNLRVNKVYIQTKHKSSPKKEKLFDSFRRRSISKNEGEISINDMDDKNEIVFWKAVASDHYLPPSVDVDKLNPVSTSPPPFSPVYRLGASKEQNTFSTPRKVPQPKRPTVSIQKFPVTSLADNYKREKLPGDGPKAMNQTPSPGLNEILQVNPTSSRKNDPSINIPDNSSTSNSRPSTGFLAEHYIGFQQQRSITNISKSNYDGNSRTSVASDENGNPVEMEDNEEGIDEENEDDTIDGVEIPPAGTIRSPLPKRYSPPSENDDGQMQFDDSNVTTPIEDDDMPKLEQSEIGEKENENLKENALNNQAIQNTKSKKVSQNQNQNQNKSFEIQKSSITFTGVQKVAKSSSSKKVSAHGRPKTTPGILPRQSEHHNPTKTQHQYGNSSFYSNANFHSPKHASNQKPFEPKFTSEVIRGKSLTSQPETDNKKKDVTLSKHQNRNSVESASTNGITKYNMDHNINHISTNSSQNLTHFTENRNSSGIDGLMITTNGNTNPTEKKKTPRLETPKIVVTKQRRMPEFPLLVINNKEIRSALNQMYNPMTVPNRRNTAYRNFFAKFVQDPEMMLAEASPRKLNLARYLERHSTQKKMNHSSSMSNFFEGDNKTRRSILASFDFERKQKKIQKQKQKDSNEQSKNSIENENENQIQNENEEEKENEDQNQPIDISVQNHDHQPSPTIQALDLYSPRSSKSRKSNSERGGFFTDRPSRRHKTFSGKSAKSARSRNSAGVEFDVFSPLENKIGPFYQSSNESTPEPFLIRKFPATKETKDDLELFSRTRSVSPFILPSHTVNLNQKPSFKKGDHKKKRKTKSAGTKINRNFGAETSYFNSPNNANKKAKNHKFGLIAAEIDHSTNVSISSGFSSDQDQDTTSSIDDQEFVNLGEKVVKRRDSWNEIEPEHVQIHHISPKKSKILQPPPTKNPTIYTKFKKRKPFLYNFVVEAAKEMEMHEKNKLSRVDITLNKKSLENSPDPDSINPKGIFSALILNILSFCDTKSWIMLWKHIRHFKTIFRNAEVMFEQRNQFLIHEIETEKLLIAKQEKMQLCDLTLHMVTFMQDRVSSMHLGKVFEDIDNRKNPIGLKIIKLFEVLFPKKQIFRALPCPTPSKLDSILIDSSSKPQIKDNSSKAPAKDTPQRPNSGGKRSVTPESLKICDMETEDLLFFDYKSIPHASFGELKKKVVALDKELKTTDKKLSRDAYALFLWVRLLCVQQTMDTLNEIEEEMSILQLFHEMAKKSFE